MEKQGMFQKYKNGFSFFMLVIVATLILAVFAGVVVFPLWFFSQEAPIAYTITLCSVIGIALFLAIGRIIRKKAHDSKFLLFLLKVFIFVVFLGLAVFFLFKFDRLVALIFVVIPCIISFVLNLIFNKSKKSC